MTTLDSVKEKFERLYVLRQAINQIEENAAQQAEPLKKERDALNEQLVADMKELDLKSLKVSSGDSFVMASKKGVSILSLPHALQWAKENGAVKIDTQLLAQKAKDGVELPANIFQPVETHYISVRKAKKEGGEE